MNTTNTLRDHYLIKQAAKWSSRSSHKKTRSTYFFGQTSIYFVSMSKFEFKYPEVFSKIS